MQLSLRLCGTYSAKDAALMNALQLAYIGDAVWETVVRDMMIHRGLSVRHMHSACVRHVNAHAQACFLHQLTDLLDEQEQEIARRGRNAHAHHAAPKNQDPGDYAASTGFEALIGFLFLTGRDERILQLAEILIGGNEDG